MDTTIEDQPPVEANEVVPCSERTRCPVENGLLKQARRRPDTLSAVSLKPMLYRQLRKARYFPRPRNNHVPSCRPSQRSVVMQCMPELVSGSGEEQNRIKEQVCKRSRTDHQSKRLAIVALQSISFLFSAYGVFSPVADTEYACKNRFQLGVRFIRPLQTMRQEICSYQSPVCFSA
jgi:hypothetical protein